MKWEVQIAGNESDLRELSKSLNGDNLSIEEKDGQYFLLSSQFDGSTNAQEVNSVASDILSILTGATKLSLGGRTPLQIANIARVGKDGGRDVFVSVSETIHLRSSLGLKIERSDGTIEVVNPADNVSGWMQLGLANSTVAKALRLFGTKEHNWVSLYRLYEVIEEDFGGIDKIADEGWATKKSIRRFKHTANSPSAIGDAARHGTESTDPPARPMELGEARALVKFILRNWLSTKP